MIRYLASFKRNQVSEGSLDLISGSLKINRLLHEFFGFDSLTNKTQSLSLFLSIEDLSHDVSKVAGNVLLDDFITKIQISLDVLGVLQIKADTWVIFFDQFLDIH